MIAAAECRSTATTSGDSGRRGSVSSRRRVDVDVLPRQGPQRIGKADRGAGARVDHGHGGQLAVGSCRQQLFSAGEQAHLMLLLLLLILIFFA